MIVPDNAMITSATSSTMQICPAMCLPYSYVGNHDDDDDDDHFFIFIQYGIG